MTNRFRDLEPFDRLIVVIAVLCALTATGFVLTSDFHADDFQLLRRAETPLGQAVASFLNGPDPDAHSYYRPAAHTIQRLILACCGPHAAALRLANLLLHLAAVGLVWRLARSLGAGPTTGLWASLIFAIHPAHAEAVVLAANISGMGGAAFYLAGLVALDGFLLRPSWRSGTLAITAFLASLAFSETAITFPIAGVLLWWYRGREPRRLWPIIGTGLILAAVIAWRHVIGVDHRWFLAAVTANPLAWVRNGLFYLIQFVAPVRTLFHLWGFDQYAHLRSALPAIPHTPVYIAAVAILGIGVALIAIRLRRRVLPEGRMGLGLALIPALPFLGFTHTAMRLLYLPSAGLALAVAAATRGGVKRGSMMWVFRGWVVIMALALVDQSVVWRQAGKLAHVVLDQAEGVCRATPVDEAIVFTDVPRQHAGTMVLSIGFIEGLCWRMGEHRPSIFEYGNPYLPPARTPANAHWYQWTGNRFAPTVAPAALAPSL